MRKKELVRLTTRPSRDGKTFSYRLDYVDLDGKRKRISLGHADKTKAERQLKQKERELRMGISAPLPMSLSEFWQDCLERTKGQVRKSTLRDRDTAMRELVSTVGDIMCYKLRFEHGERLIQASLDKGNTPATAYKKICAIKRVLQLGVLRGQLEDNPFKHLKRPKIAGQEIHIYSDDECHRFFRATRETKKAGRLNWELLIATALCTGMRRGELLNTIWRDVDFEDQTIRVAPKKDTATTWEWLIKDSERRTLPLTDEVTRMLIAHQEQQPNGCVYVFVPMARCKHIHKRREQGNWTTEDGRCPVNNFSREFNKLKRRASVEAGEFHDFRRTCLTRWFANGLSEYDVMKLAGHSDFETTHKFYLRVRQDLNEKARAASAAAMAKDFGTRLARTPISDRKDLTADVGKC